MARIRDQGPWYSPGGYTYRIDAFGNKYSYVYMPSYRSRFKWSSDHVSQGPPYTADNECLLFEEVNKKSLLLNRTAPKGKQHVNVARPEPYANTSPDAPLFSAQEWLNVALSRLNPRNPSVDVPLFAWELLEFPLLLKSLGLSLAKKRPPPPDTMSKLSDRARRGTGGVAGGVLSYNFGWRPLISDLNTLLSAVEAGAAAETQIANLAKGKSIKMNLGTESTSWVSSESTIDGGNGNHLSWRWYLKNDRKIWCTFQGKPDFPIPDFGENRSPYVRDLMSHDLSYSTIWNAIPWSWLTDYLFSMGSYMAATRGGLSFSSTVCNIMHTDRITGDQRVSSQQGFGLWEVTNGRALWVRKNRIPMPHPKARVTVKLSPLSAGQLSNLASLSVLSALRSKKK